MNQKFMAAVCLVVVSITLSLGLWPFHSPKNDVTWMPQGGLKFGRYGTVIGSGPLKAPRSSSASCGSIELWTQPDHWTSATILAFYRPEERLLVTLRQSLTDLELVAETGDEEDGMKKARLIVDDALAPALRQNQPVFITVTVGPERTMIYVDGALVKAVSRSLIPQDAFLGRLIVGDSPRQPDSFSGQVLGLAIYDTELNRETILQHYRGWIWHGWPDVEQTQLNIALYTFNEKTGAVVHNNARAEGDLRIPEHYAVVDKIWLEPFWREFNFSRSYWSGNLKNIIGFMPLGFCFYAYFAVAGQCSRAVLLTLIGGALVSLAIEVLQGPLPTRDSGTTDIITNTIGTWLGVLCYRRIYLDMARLLPWFGWFAPKSDHGTLA